MTCCQRLMELVPIIRIKSGADFLIDLVGKASCLIGKAQSFGACNFRSILAPNLAAVALRYKPAKTHREHEKMTKPLVIVGGGFAGVYAARFLQRRLPADWEIVLFSLENHFVFTPLL